MTDPIDTLTYEDAVPEGATVAREDSGVIRYTPHVTPGAPSRFNAIPMIDDLDREKHVWRDVLARFAVEAHDPDGRDDDLRYRWEWGDGHRSYTRTTSHRYAVDGEYTVTVRVSDAVESVTRTFAITVRRYPRYDVRIIAVAPNPEGRDTSTRYVRLLNAEDDDLDLRGWSVATGRDRDHLVNHPIRERVVIDSDTHADLMSPTVAITLPNTTATVNCGVRTEVSPIACAIPRRTVRRPSLSAPSIAVA